MFLFEFNNLDLDEKYEFVFHDPTVRFKSYRKESDHTISLWNCGDFFAEVYCSTNDKKVIKIEGIELYDKRIDLYIDYVEKHKDDEY